ncbi:L-lactate permease [Entomobacter blattae]|uniref:L-lactate permease n=1 Tax=Entomobacter blattae TaxID=2762277 RepID=A0A7H1NS86_9PROT|nr:L-lactate permease [Entomobacter blattae]QNT78646.1 L-lactate permease [Entomobacter blattae]
MELLSILPLIICAVSIVVFRQSAILGAGYGILTACILFYLAADIFPISAHVCFSIVIKSLILTCSAAIVIIPGLYFNAILKEQDIIKNIQQWIEALPFAKEHKVFLLLFGLLPAVESLTGFGVSLFLSIPIFFHMFPSFKAYRLAMLGMNIMPWGTLALATIVGATLSDTTIPNLGWQTALISAPVFPILSLAALYTMGKPSQNLKNSVTGLLLASLLSCALIFFNKLNLVEVAGVMAGLSVCLIGASLLPRTFNLSLMEDKRTVYKAFTPYGLILVLILLERFIPGLYDFLGKLLVLHYGNISFKVLTSPGIILCIVAIALFIGHTVPLPHKRIIKRSWIACFSLFSFILLSQTMKEGSMISVFAQILNHWGNTILLTLSPLIGMSSGFITGSNLGGNALMMNMQANIGHHTGLLNSLTGAQNSGAGQAVFTSIPIIVLIMTIAKDIPQEQESVIKEYQLLRFGLGVAFFILLTLIFSTWISKNFLS